MSCRHLRLPSLELRRRLRRPAPSADRPRSGAERSLSGRCAATRPRV